MIRAIIVIVTVLFLIGSFAYAEYGTEKGLLGVMAEPEGENTDGDQNDHEGERSDVAEAVLGVLGEWETDEPKSPEDDGRGFGETVADLAREGNLGEEVAAAARGATNEEKNNDANDNDNNNVNGDEPERSKVADAVLETLGGDASPGDGNDFGQNVAEQAQDGGLGQDVSQAARGINDSTSSNPGNKSNPASSQGRGSPPR